MFSQVGQRRKSDKLLVGYSSEGTNLAETDMRKAAESDMRNAAESDIWKGTSCTI